VAGARGGRSCRCRSGRRPHRHAHAVRAPRLQLIAAVAATAVAVAEWSVPTIDALRFGMIGIDTF
jgi:hypothetical protein